MGASSFELRNHFFQKIAKKPFALRGEILLHVCMKRGLEALAGSEKIAAPPHDVEVLKALMDPATRTRLRRVLDTCDRLFPAPTAPAPAEITPKHCAAIDREVRATWPSVVIIHTHVRWEGAGSERRMKRDLNIHLDPFSREEQQRHWPLADKLREILGDGCSCFFLPAMDVSRLSGEVIYNRGKHPVCVAEDRPEVRKRRRRQPKKSSADGATESGDLSS